MRKTILNSTHIAMGAKMVEFGGWHMPVAYSQIRDEHRATRTAAGLFDLSHMGRFIVRGKDRVRLMDRVATNDISLLKPGEAGYGLLCNEQGNALDDIITYAFPEHLFVVVNAGNRDRDFAWIDEQRRAGGFDATLEDASERLAMIALQGPRAIELSKQFSPDPLADLGYYHALEGTFAGVPATIARTGYTGEDGVEVYLPAADAARVWNELLEKGKAVGLLAVGLGARDTLRLEAGMPLYGHELGLDTNPLEAGLGFAVKLKKAADFVGKAALAKVKADGPARKLICIINEGKKIPREGYPVKRGGEVVGKVTSGTFSPSFERPICMAYVVPSAGEVGTDLTVDVRGEALPGKVVKRPFYKRGN